MITVLYDGKCGLCRREITHYMKVAPSGVFNWQDITEEKDILTATGISYVQGLREIHALDAKGHIHVGVDAFLLIWRNIPKWRLVGHLVSLPGVSSCAKFLYRHFANWRFKRLDHCQVALKTQPVDQSANQSPKA